ncbi:MAG: hypothetical protein H0U50_01645 [Pyrinomonadaceae bacterium]|nr:hypothetical protein [Pyrinomonadaceae bacterium]
MLVNLLVEGGNRTFQFGSSSDKIVPADFTGDGKPDIAFWRPSTGFWFVLRSEDNSFYSFPFGTNDDVPAPANYDGDGKDFVPADYYGDNKVAAKFKFQIVAKIILSFIIRNLNFVIKLIGAGNG